MVEEKGKKEVAPREVEERKQRRPLGVGRQRLALTPKQLAYFRAREEVPRWINDKPGRLEAASQEDSYRFISKEELQKLGGVVGEAGRQPGDDLGGCVSRIVGREDDGSPITAYLMVKSKADYDADMAERTSKIEEREAEMQQGIDSYGAPGMDGRYIPGAGISVQRNRQ